MGLVAFGSRSIRNRLSIEGNSQAQCDGALFAGQVLRNCGVLLNCDIPTLAGEQVCVGQTLCALRQDSVRSDKKDRQSVFRNILAVSGFYDGRTGNRS